MEVIFVPNGRLYAAVALTNNGDHDVRIEGAPASASYYWGFERLAVAAASDGAVFGFSAPYEPFRPFTLRVGESREVRLEFRLADCDPASLNPGGYSTRRGLRLRYRILGITRTTDVPFRDAGIALEAMGICAHPIVEEVP